MSVSTAACCAALLQQQQQAIQHHENHCDQAVNHGDGAVHSSVLNDTATIASDHSVPKQCTVVEHGRVVVKAMPPTDGKDNTPASKQQRQ